MKVRGETAIRCDVLAREHRLNARQAAVLEHVLRAGSLSIADLRELFPAVAKRSLQRDLKALLEKGFVVEEGASTDPTRRYRAGQL